MYQCQLLQMGLNLSEYLTFFQETSLKVENSNLLELRQCHSRFNQNIRRRRQLKYQIFCKTSKIKHFFVALYTVSFLFFTPMLDAVTALDGKPMDFKVFQNFLGLFISCLRSVSQNNNNKILTLILNFFWKFLYQCETFIFLN